MVVKSCHICCGNEYLFASVKMGGIVLGDSTLVEYTNMASKHWCLALGLVLVLSFPVTYLITTINSWRQRKSDHDGKEPPTYPYWIPFLGHVVDFTRDRMSFFGQIK